MVKKKEVLVVTSNNAYVKSKKMKSSADAVVADASGALSSCKEKPTSIAKTPKAIVGACGLSCNACTQMKDGKCKGCGAGDSVSAEMVKMKNCSILNCASMKRISYCRTDCMKFADCKKLMIT